MSEQLSESAPVESKPPGAGRTGESEVYLLRVWREGGRSDETEWRGKIQNILNPEAHAFAGLSALVETLKAMLPGASAGNDESQEEGE